METSYTASTKIAFIFLLLLTAFSVYRAATRDITHDEAWNYDRYIGPDWSESLKHFDSNNCFLYTLLARISTRRFHLTELSLRLPALLAGLLYFAAVWRLCKPLGWGFLPGIALFTLIPTAFDALSEARGYGMAMAFLLWAILLLPRRLTLAAACLALSVASCLSFIAPALGLLAVVPLLRRNGLARSLYLPFIVYLFVLLVIPLNRVLLSDFAEGAKTLPALTVVLVLIAGVLAVWRRSDGRLLMAGGSALVALLVLVLAHKFLKAPFPERGAIYWIPLFTLVALTVLRPYPRVLAMLAACFLIYAWQAAPVTTTITRDMAKALRADAGQNRVRIAASPELEPVVNYYAWRYLQANWGRVEPNLTAGSDYYLVTEADWPRVQSMGARVLRRDGRYILARR